MSAADRLSAPFCALQQRRLAEWQACGWVHELTCGKDHEGDKVLVPSAAGMSCPTCGYVQTLVPEVCAMPLPPNPLEALKP